MMKLIKVFEKNSQSLSIWGNNLFITEYKILDTLVKYPNDRLTREDFWQIQVDLKNCHVAKKYHEDRFVGIYNDRLFFQSSHDRLQTETTFYDGSEKTYVKGDYFLTTQRLIDESKSLYFVSNDKTFKIYDLLSNSILWEKEGVVGFWFRSAGK